MDDQRLHEQMGFATEVLMEFIAEYFKLIDLLALAALAALACAALIENGSVWLFVAGILAATWGAVRVLGLS